jgi:hypothetical protein
MRAFEERVIKLKLAIVWTTPEIYAGRRQLHEPTNIVVSHKVPCRTHDVRAQYGPTIESVFDVVVRRTPHSECKCPLGSFEVLRLYRPEPTHNLNGLSKTWRREFLVMQSLRKVYCIHLF